MKGTKYDRIHNYVKLRSQYHKLVNIIINIRSRNISSLCSRLDNP